MKIQEIDINGKPEKIRAKIESVALSSHGDQRDLLKFIQSNKKIKKVILNH